jgi:hypothetical protein
VLDSPRQFPVCPSLLIIKILLLPGDSQVGMEEFLVIEITRHFCRLGNVCKIQSP